MNYVKCVVALTCLVVVTIAGNIDLVDDSDLIHLLTKGDNVVTLFTKENCPKCVELENIVLRIKNELKEQLESIVVKAENSHMVGLYNPLKEPSLIFFRQGIPLLYSGNYNADDITELFMNNKEPVVKELSDENFEHLTQAATGATTGDWFIFFYSADCVLCQRLYAIWESVGARLKRKLNVARVNRLDKGVSTAKRFKIAESPEFIFIRSGKIYRYKSKEYTPDSFVKFASGDYLKDANSEPVPSIPNPMENFLADQIRFLEDNKNFVVVGLAGLLLIIFVIKYLMKFIYSDKKEKTKIK